VSVLSKDIQDQGRAVDHLDVIPKDLLELTLVTGRKLVVKEDDVGTLLLDLLDDLRDLARADERSGVGANQLLYLVAHDNDAGRTGQSFQLG
jgi:hypothetical protein